MSGMSSANQHQNHHNKSAYTKYKLENVREQNKVKKLIVHLEEHPDDPSAKIAFDKIKKIVPNIVRRLMQKRTKQILN